MPKDVLKLPRKEWLKHAKDADIILTSRVAPVDKEALSGPNLKLVSTASSGFDHIDMQECNRRGILVANTQCSLDDTCADVIMGSIIACARRICESNQFISEGKWNKSVNIMGLDIHHKTMGILGLGHIGKKVAKRAKGFDMNVLYYDKVGDNITPLDRILRESDFLTICLPITSETYHLIGKKEFDLMKPTSIIANIGRGAVIDNEALADAIAARKIYGAALDVTDPEPLPPNHRLIREKTVVITPHIGSATEETRNNMAAEAARACVQFCKGERITDCVNPFLYDKK
jgi:phosphoglycerate dehydrogenase-like enzyme